MRILVFRVDSVLSCPVVSGYRRSGETYCFHVNCCPEDGTGIFLRNVGSHLLVYNTVSLLTKWNAYDSMKCFAKYVGRL